MTFTFCLFILPLTAPSSYGSYPVVRCTQFRYVYALSELLRYLGIRTPCLLCRHDHELQHGLLRPDMRIRMTTC